MYLKFAWRYFKAKKSAQAINMIAWVTTAVIAIATCCQVVVLSVFNGFEDLVKSLYSSFYNDIKVVPESGKTFHFSAAQFQQIKNSTYTFGASAIAEEKALLKNGEAQTVVNLKGVDENFSKISDVPDKLINGDFEETEGIPHKISTFVKTIVKQFDRNDIEQDTLQHSFDYKSNGELKSIILSTELYSETIYQET